MYFITICVQHRACLFGKITNGEMVLNDAGKMVFCEWEKLPERFPNIALHRFVVMPNHFHGILEIVCRQPYVWGQPQGIDPTGVPNPGATLVVAPLSHVVAPLSYMATPLHVSTQNNKAKTIGDMMDAFKSITTVKYIHGVRTSNWKPFDKRLWQRNYYERIVRDARAYYNISRYIANNPLKWAGDKFRRV
jgi:REP element-mobilizing transposase RayT